MQPAKTETGANDSRSSNKQNNTTGSLKNSKDGDNKYKKDSFEDKVMDILTNKIILEDGEWIVTSPETDDSDIMEDDSVNKGCQCSSKGCTGSSDSQSVHVKKCSCGEHIGKSEQK